MGHLNVHPYNRTWLRSRKEALHKKSGVVSSISASPSSEIFRHWKVTGAEEKRREVDPSNQEELDGKIKSYRPAG